MHYNAKGFLDGKIEDDPVIPIMIDSYCTVPNMYAQYYQQIIHKNTVFHDS